MILFILYLALVVFPLMQHTMGMHPVLWYGAFFFTISRVYIYVTSDSTIILLCCGWICCIAVMVVFLMNSAVINREDNTFLIFGKITIPQIIVRKFFHIMAMAMFIPGTLLQPKFMYLSYGVAFAAFLWIESLRVELSESLARAFHASLKQFLDHRDSGALILTHMYLLIGCAIPTWLNDMLKPSPLLSLCGVLTLGLGDTMASAVGVRYGKTKWPGSKKSIQGTVAFIVAIIVMGMMICKREEWTALIIGATLSGLFEAFTSQIDNLVLPAYCYAIMKLFI